ncbi:MAG: GGDEF domain-containing protein [Bacilli bacterium]|nr:GGDEF domain-containing protein [Bacilli bacterium]
MHYFKLYFINNFVSLCICAVMLFTCVRRFRQSKKISISIFVLIATVLLLSIVEVLGEYSAVELANPTLCEVCSSTSYVLRAFSILPFIVLSGQDLKNKWSYLLLIPIGLTLIIYILPFFPATERLVFHFEISDVDGHAHWLGGDTPLRFTSHIVSALYLVYFLYRSFLNIRLKHYMRAISIIICSAVVVAAVIIETVDSSGELHLTNVSIAVCIVFYYLYVYVEMGEVDALTDLFNRAMYYSDLPKMSRSITAVIQIDMNGLKYFNDTFGHAEGDRGLKTIAETIKRSETKTMYSYRLGGDEFTMLCNGDSVEAVTSTVASIKAELEATKYRVSIGYACRGTDGEEIDALLKTAEKRMYDDKAQFYQHSDFDRRKIESPTE